MPLLHAFEFLSDETTHQPAIAAVFGGDATLRTWSIRALTSSGDVTQVDGESARWSDLRDDLATASLFDMGDKRTLVVRDADKFVTNHRSDIEGFVAKPSSACRLILDLGSLASNTRLYKGIHKDHLLVACGASPDKKLGVTAASRRKFLTSYVAARHGAKLAATAADALVEMLGRRDRNA